MVLVSFVQTNQFFYSLVATFFVLTIPLTISPLFYGDYHWLITFYTHIIVFTHFLSTLGLYTNPKNRAFFRENKKNIAIYYFVPILILCTFAPLTFLSTQSAILILVVTSIIRFTDYFHTNRQTFGVLQLMRGKVVDHSIKAYFYLLILFLITNHLSKTTVLNLTILTTGLLVLSLCGFWYFIWMFINQRQWKCLIYFIMQSLALIPGILNPKWYFLGLAVHSIEYHLLIIKRFNTEPSSILKGKLKIFFFYLCLIAISLLVHIPRKMDSTFLKYFDLNFLYSSVLLTHYYLDSFVWRYRKPIYQEAINHL